MGTDFEPKNELNEHTGIELLSASVEFWEFRPGRMGNTQ
jgi:hypothetical protein